VRKALLPATLLALVLMPHAAASAAQATAIRSGWWTSAPIAAPDVPEDGLLVQGGVDQESPTAYAAVSATLLAGTAATQLTLHVSEDGATTPGATLAVCPLTGSFSPSAGGSADDGPLYGCELEVTAEPDADGDTYRFDLRGLDASGEVALAILPTAPSTRVVLDAPGIDALESTEAPAPNGDGGFEDLTGGDIGGGDSSSGAADFDFDSGTGAFISPSGSAFAIPETLPPATSEEVGDLGAGPDTGPADEATRLASSSTSSGADSSPWLLFVVLALAAAGLWLGAGRDVASAEELAP
jgi:hypothetical protein